jgi:hypothetical protein
MAEFEHLQLSDSITVSKLVGSGGFADVFDGSMTIDGSKQKKVAVKRFRVIYKKEENAFQVPCVMIDRPCR